MDEIRQLKTSDYANITEDISEWVDMREELPAYFWKKIKDTDTHVHLKEFWRRVKEELYKIYGEKRDKAKSFADSRFTPLKEMVERGMVSCGALTHIFGTVFRKFGVPVKYVHGRLDGQEGEEDRHAWLEIYDPKNKSWFEADPGHPEFGMYPEARRVKVYHDWFDLKRDYEKGEF